VIEIKNVVLKYKKVNICDKKREERINAGENIMDFR
jgi:hypothetical protein